MLARRAGGAQKSLVVTARSCPQQRLFGSTPSARADFTHVVIGGGVVGLATARALAQHATSSSSSSSSTSSTLLLERHGLIGSETSSRNSEVIHAGLYYGPNTLKTRLCIAGKQKLYDFCAARGVGHANTGKWIVAQQHEEREALERLHATCRDELGVPTRWVGAEEAREQEPGVRAAAGVLESPTTGIVDSHGLMVALQGEFEDAGGMVSLNSEVVGIEPLPHGTSEPGSNGWRLSIRDRTSSSGDECTTIEAETIINSAGLGAVDIHNLVVSSSGKPELRTQLYYAKGNYFGYSASSPKVKRLIYPVTLPGAGGLGTHLTIDLAGRIRFGPDIEWVDDPTDLAVNTARFPEALAAIRRYMPDIDENALSPDYAGMRPKLGKAGAVGAGKGFLDFYIKKEEGFRGWVNLLGMESPGLTSSIAVGEFVRDLLYGRSSME
ncbi:FAD dependent oxidoreductase [Xylariaceae sp. FL0255]|nr:FAD dependent oxidoreductase [Xylariaceae sp. FL0255]